MRQAGIGSCALLVSHWTWHINVEVRRRATISPALRDQRPKFELPELVASLSKEPSLPTAKVRRCPPTFPWLYCYGAAANPNPPHPRNASHSAKLNRKTNTKGKSHDESLSTQRSRQSIQPNLLGPWWLWPLIIASSPPRYEAAVAALSSTTSWAMDSARKPAHLPVEAWPAGRILRHHVACARGVLSSLNYSPSDPLNLIVTSITAYCRVLAAGCWCSCWVLPTCSSA